MPPFISTRCPECQHLFSVDLAKLRAETQIVYRGEDATHEYRIHCPQCGHEFKIAYPPPPQAGERP